MAEPRAPLGRAEAPLAGLWGTPAGQKAQHLEDSKIRVGPRGFFPKAGVGNSFQESARVCVREEREGAMRRLQLTWTGVRFAEPQSKEPVQGTGRRVGFGLGCLCPHLMATASQLLVMSEAKAREI